MLALNIRKSCRISVKITWSHIPLISWFSPFWLTDNLWRSELLGLMRHFHWRKVAAPNLFQHSKWYWFYEDLLVYISSIEKHKVIRSILEFNKLTWKAIIPCQMTHFFRHLTPQPLRCFFKFCTLETLIEMRKYANFGSQFSYLSWDIAIYVKAQFYKIKLHRHCHYYFVLILCHFS